MAGNLSSYIILKQNVYVLSIYLEEQIADMGSNMSMEWNDISTLPLKGTSTEMTTAVPIDAVNQTMEVTQVEKVIGPVKLIVCILGLLGNLASFIVMSRKEFSSLPMAQLIRYLAESDLVNLVTSLNRLKWFEAIFGLRVRSLHDYTCIANNWLDRTSGFFYAWMVYNN